MLAMRSGHRHLAPVLSLVLVLCAACGGGHGASAAKTTTSSANVATTAARRIATHHAVAYIAVQLDTSLRGKAAGADPCLNDHYDGCVGAALSSYKQIHALADQIPKLLHGVTDPKSSLYSGDLPSDLVGLSDETDNAAASVIDTSATALQVCVPSFPPECKAANAKLRDALIGLYKVMNLWRKEL
jgi:hypothetical protein